MIAIAIAVRGSMEGRSCPSPSTNALRSRTTESGSDRSRVYSLTSVMLTILEKNLVLYTSLDLGPLRSCNGPKSREQGRQSKAAVPACPAQESLPDAAWPVRLSLRGEGSPHRQGGPRAGGGGLPDPGSLRNLRKAHLDPHPQ